MNTITCPQHGDFVGSFCRADGCDTVVQCGGLPALDGNINWIHQPAFDKAFADLTGTEPENDEWRREVNWNFTGDDLSFAQ